MKAPESSQAEFYRLTPGRWLGRRSANLRVCWVRFEGSVVLGLSTLALVVVSLGVLMVVIATLVTFATGRYGKRVLFTSTSPDGRYLLVASERADFPANEFLDPSATLSIRLTDVTTGELVDEFVFDSFEYWDFNDKATVSWGSDGRVRVSEIDTKGHHVAATLGIGALR